MQRKSRLFIANIVLGIVLAVLLCISIAVTVIFHGVFEEAKREYASYDWQELYGGSTDYGSWDYEDDWYDDTDWDYESSWDYESVYYTLPSITGASAELLGQEYQDGIAYEGYQYYRVTMQVYNAGTEYLAADYMDFTVEGAEYDDVYMNYEPYGEGGQFDYRIQKLIPSCQTATVSFVIEVKDGLEDVTLKIFRDYEEEAYATYVLNLK